MWLINGQIFRSKELTVLYVDRYNGPRKNSNMNSHDYWELSVVFRSKEKIKGTKQTVELKRFCACLIPPTVEHTEFSDGIVDSVWIGIKGPLLDRFDDTKIHFVSSKDLAESIEEIWLKRIRSLGPIGPELDGLAQAAVGLFLRLLSTTENNSHESFVKDILLHINKNYANDLSIPLLAEKFGYSESYFYRIFKRYTDQSPLEYITDVRLNNAILLMKKSSLSIKKISHMVGYRDPHYFSRLFHEKTGQSPKEFYVDNYREFT